MPYQPYQRTGNAYQYPSKSPLSQLQVCMKAEVPFSGADDAASNLTTIGDQYFADQSAHQLTNASIIMNKIVKKI